MTRLLMIDSDRELAQGLKSYLKSEDQDLELAFSAEEGLERLDQESWDLAVLEPCLKTAGGKPLLAEVRGRWELPVLALSSRGESVDRIVALEMGADDCVGKRLESGLPVSFREVTARINAVLRRCGRGPTGRSYQVEDLGTAVPLVRLGDVEVFPAAKVLLKNGEEVPLTSMEYRIAEYLIQQAGVVVRRDEVASRVLDRGYTASDRSLDMHICSLRRKLGPHPDGSERIKTLRGEGYFYSVPTKID